MLQLVQTKQCTSYSLGSGLGYSRNASRSMATGIEGKKVEFTDGSGNNKTLLNLNMFQWQVLYREIKYSG